MKVQCSNCGESITVNNLGRRPFDMPVTKVYDALRLYRSVSGAANNLECSRAYIYKILKIHGVTPADVINSRVVK